MANGQSSTENSRHNADTTHIMGGGSTMNINKLQLGAIPLSPDLLPKANIGIWAFELDEGQEPRMYVDDTMLGLLGLEHQVSPEETYHAWYDNVDDDSYDLVHEAVDNMMREHAEVQYPWHHPDGRIRIVRCGGVKNPEYTAGIRIEGTHQDVTEVVHYDEERNKQLAQNNQRIMALEDNFEALYDVELESARYTAFVRGDYYQSKVVDNLRNGDDYFKDLRRDIESVVYSEDVDGLYNLLTKEAIQKELAKNERIEHYYRIPIDNVLQWYKIRVVYKDKAKNNVIIGVFNADEELEAKQIAEQREQIAEQAAFTNFFLDTYLSAYYINLETLTCKIYKRSKKPELDYPVITNYFDTIQEYIERDVHPDDRKDLIDIASPEKMSGILKEKSEYNHTFRDICGGKEKIYRMQVIRGADEKHAAFGFKDITDEVTKEQEQQRKLQKAFDAAQEEARRSDLLYEASNSGKWSYDIDGNDQVVNVHYSNKVLQLVKNEFSGDPLRWIEYLHPDDKERVTTAFWAAIHDHSCQTPYDTTFRLVSEKGKASWIKTSGRLLRHDDGTAELIGISINITEQIERERRHQEELQKAFDAAQAANRAKTTFMNNMSHDIRTPMNAIIGYTSMAQKYINDTKRAKDFLGKIGIAGNNLLELINQVLDMSRIESGRIVLEEAPLDLMERSSELIEIIDSSAKLKNIKMATHIHDIHNTKVYADPGRMNQLLMNILGNAIKYTPEGGHIKHSVTQVDCDKPGYGTYVIVVEDNGIGMSKEYLQTIFEPFSRENTSTVSKIQGTGLGMAIVKRLVDLMGGTIEIESEQGKGTKITVTLTFRLQEKSKVNGQRSTTGSEEINAGKFKGKRILLVEDNEMNREIATMILEEYEMIVEQADDGDIAVSKIQSVAECGEINYYDAILMDIQMPRMGGYKATRIIRETVPDLKTPIIAVSANAFEEDKKKSREAGMNDHIAKPIDIEELLHTLAKFI